MQEEERTQGNCGERSFARAGSGDLLHRRRGQRSEASWKDARELSPWRVFHRSSTSLRQAEQLLLDQDHGGAQARVLGELLLNHSVRVQRGRVVSREAAADLGIREP